MQMPQCCPGDGKREGGRDDCRGDDGSGSGSGDDERESDSDSGRDV